jgi:peptidoglycan/LPS O-acetylase OafA/YrhL
VSINEIVSSAVQHGPSELKRIDYLDGWRGLAILLVLVAHFLQLKWMDLGTMGVDVFFVLSGMLMANILFVKKVSLTIFYKRRISRVFPVFIIFYQASAWEAGFFLCLTSIRIICIIFYLFVLIGL